MNFLVDGSVDRQIVERLRQDGHAVRYIAEMEPGSSDDRLLDLANREADVLLTADKDFGELVFRHGRLTFGILLIRWQVCRRRERQMSLLLPSVSTAQSFLVPSPCLHQGLSGFAGWSDERLRVPWCALAANRFPLTWHHSLSSKSLNGPVVRTPPGVLFKDPHQIPGRVGEASRCLL